MGLFNRNKEQTQQLSQRQILENKFTSVRSNILFVVICTLINIILLVTNSNTYYLFSAYVPFAFVDLGMAFCGMYPAEYYGEDFAELLFVDKSFFAVMVAIAAVILVLYLISWIFSGKGRLGWMIFALVFFSIDTVALLLLNGISIDWALDYVFHAWVVFSLASGVSAGRKLKKLPEEPEPVVETERSVPWEL